MLPVLLVSLKAGNMSRASNRAGKKALVCRDCVKATKKGSNARNVGSFRGRPAAYLRHIRNAHNV